MYITANMANLQKCSRCKSEIDVSYFGLNRKKQPYKTCVNCRSKVKKTSCTQLKRTDTDFVDDTISTTTQQSEGFITNATIHPDIDNQSTTAESSASPEPTCTNTLL